MICRRNCQVSGQRCIDQIHLVNPVWGKVLKTKYYKKCHSGISSVGKASCIKVSQKRCDWTCVSLILVRSIGVRKNPSHLIYEASIDIAVREVDEKKYHKNLHLINFLDFLYFQTSRCWSWASRPWSGPSWSRCCRSWRPWRTGRWPNGPSGQISFNNFYQRAILYKNQCKFTLCWNSSIIVCLFKSGDYS